MTLPKSLGAPSFAEKYQVAFYNAKISSAIYISCNPLFFLVDTHIYSFKYLNDTPVFVLKVVTFETKNGPDH